MDTAQWPQEIAVKTMDEIVNNTCSSMTNNPCSSAKQNSSLERKARPQKDQALNCPRCNSTNTKFCYYNNYSLTQPRYFCKTCRRYWTEGGLLRNIPVGGGSRKNKRSSSSSSSSSSTITSGSSSKIKIPDLGVSNSSQPSISHDTKIHDGHDLNLGFQPNQEFRGLCEFVQLPHVENTPRSQFPINSTSSVTGFANISALELLTGFTSSRGVMTSFMPMPISDPNAVFSSGFSLQSDFKTALSFNLEGTESGYHDSLQGVPETSNGKLLFPFIEDLKQVSNASDQDNEQSREHEDSNGYWSGMLGGAGSW
ncbi:hypothetical protein Nepgr_011144 [Nepenthes gracilis]|uniref:Dof zinc finger protein n=1 Tax=Nepenthes gracilis TaxID=150966 RepID=A0AAD3SDN5_NEPGR|nr:hypothetical protein Nepgr_011144 [Nepenthes gracilis]